VHPWDNPYTDKPRLHGNVKHQEYECLLVLSATAEQGNEEKFPPTRVTDVARALSCPPVTGAHIRALRQLMGFCGSRINKQRK